MSYLKRINSLPFINHISYKHTQVSDIGPSWSSCLLIRTPVLLTVIGLDTWHAHLIYAMFSVWSEPNILSMLLVLSVLTSWPWPCGFWQSWMVWLLPYFLVTIQNNWRYFAICKKYAHVYSVCPCCHIFLHIYEDIVLTSAATANWTIIALIYIFLYLNLCCLFYRYFWLILDFLMTRYSLLIHFHNKMLF